MIKRVPLAFFFLLTIAISGCASYQANEIDAAKRVEQKPEKDVIKQPTISKRAMVTMDPMTKIPAKVIGIDAFPSTLKEGAVALTEDKADLAFKTFLGENKRFFGVDTDNLKLISAKKLHGKWYVKYQQYYKGIPVYRATVGLTTTEQGKVLTYGSNYYPKIDVSIKPKIGLEEAVTVAKGSYREEKARELTAKEILKLIYAEKKPDGVVHHLAWKFLLSGDRPNPDLDKYFIIDALTGKILLSYNARFPGSRVSGTVEGEIHPGNPAAPPVSTESFEDEYVNVRYAGRTTTDAAGRYRIDVPWWVGIFGSVRSTFRLEGPYVRVQDSDGSDFGFSQKCRVNASCNHTWTDTDRDHINVFYHMNLLHDWYEERLGYSWINAWDNTTQFKAEVNHPFANAYAGSPMLFGTDPFARSSDVIYHECTHNVLYQLYGDYIGWPASMSEGYAMDEGFADYFACAVTEDPAHGEGYGGTRNLNNTTQYAGKRLYNTEGHQGGQIIGGAAWDLRNIMITELGAARGSRQADRLVFNAHQLLTTLPRDYYFSDPQESNLLLAFYLADDDNNNLNDGIPHFVEIHRAFSNHSLLQGVLNERDSYDFSSNVVGELTGGDVYFSGGKFWANNYGQRGVKDLCDIGQMPLDQVAVPNTGFSRFGVPAVVGHTHVSLAQQGEEGNYIALRVTWMSADNSQLSLEYFYLTRKITLYDKDSYDFSMQIRGELTGGDLYLTQSKFWANNFGQRGVKDLGNLGVIPLDQIPIPASGYTRFGVPAVVGHTYVSLAQQGEEGNYVIFRIQNVNVDSVTIVYLYRKANRIILYDKDSYDFSELVRGSVSGGDFYLTGLEFFANNFGQRGIKDLGDIGQVSLDQVAIPANGYTRYGVPVAIGHTYVSLAQQGEEGNSIVFRVHGVDGTSATLDFLYRPGT
jgi:Zn-dependent metalloprotease